MSWEGPDRWRDEDYWPTPTLEMFADAAVLPPPSVVHELRRFKGTVDVARDDRTVTGAYLDELYAKAARLQLLERYLAELAEDSEFRCSIGGLEEWATSCT